MKRLWRLLRSRRLAVWALIGFVVYAAIATTVSDGDWSVPYRNPIFLALAALLTASTAACAWERTRAAIVNAKLRPPSPATIARLRERPGIVIPGRSSAGTLDGEVAVLRGLHMRVLRVGDAVEARAGVAGALGSSVFHWALALLFVVIALGQLTRSEGLMGVVSGSSRPDVAESYGVLEKGAWSGALTGRVIAVPRVESNLTANGVEQGVTPYVEIRSPDGATVLASGYAYANHPIRYRSMLVHMDNNGLGAVVQVSGDGGNFTSEVLLDYNQDGVAAEPGMLSVVGPDGATIATVLIEPDAKSTPEKPLARIRAVSGDVTTNVNPEVDATVRVGEQLEIPGGLMLTVVDLTKYARLSVVNDWSVYYIYGLFLLAAIGLALAIFSPLRGARVLLVADDEGARLHVAVRHGRGDPYFPARVEAALRAALEPGGESR